MSANVAREIQAAVCDSNALIFAFEQQAEEACNALRRDDWLPALRWLGNLAVTFVELSADAAQEAYNNGSTKKAIADALGVTPATFRGMERTR